MPLDHALLIALREHPASGSELARRFERSIGFLWSATHQQIYRVLGRMEGDGWVTVTEMPQTDRPTTKIYEVTPLGEDALASWLGDPTSPDPLRSDLALKMRGATFGDREAVLDVVRTNLADHHLRLAHFKQLMKRDYPTPETLTGLELDHYLVLRGGILMEQTWITWLTDYTEAYA